MREALQMIKLYLLHFSTTTGNGANAI